MFRLEMPAPAPAQPQPVVIAEQFRWTCQRCGAIVESKAAAQPHLVPGHRAVE